MGRGTNRSYNSDGGAATYTSSCAPNGDCGRASRRKGYASDSSQGTRDGDWPATMTSLTDGSHLSATWALEPNLSKAESHTYIESRALAPPPPTFINIDGHDWQELWSKADRYTYYLQVATGHTQWEDPRSAAAPPPPPPPPPAPALLRHDRNPEVLQAHVAACKPSQIRRSLSGGPLVTVGDSSSLKQAISEPHVYDHGMVSYRESRSTDDDEKDVDRFFADVVSPSSENSPPKNNPPVSPRAQVEKLAFQFHTAAKLAAQPQQDERRYA